MLTKVFSSFLRTYSSYFDFRFPRILQQHFTRTLINKSRNKKECAVSSLNVIRCCFSCSCGLSVITTVLCTYLTFFRRWITSARALLKRYFFPHPLSINCFLIFIFSGDPFLAWWIFYDQVK